MANADVPLRRGWMGHIQRQGLDPTLIQMTIPETVLAIAVEANQLAAARRRLYHGTWYGAGKLLPGRLGEGSGAFFAALPGMDYRERISGNIAKVAEPMSPAPAAATTVWAGGFAVCIEAWPA